MIQKPNTLKSTLQAKNTYLLSHKQVMGKDFSLYFSDIQEQTIKHQRNYKLAPLQIMYVYGTRTL